VGQTARRSKPEAATLETTATPGAALIGAALIATLLTRRLSGPAADARDHTPA
jgi:hypothetical protein